tara:strand:- start:98 stop:523 length:426 start_codon:yes stop_codon:yes gene_type:complete
MSEESEDKQKQAKKIETLGKLFGTPGSLFDLINFNKRPRRRSPKGESVFTQLRRFKTKPVKENPEFDIVGRQVPDIEKQVRTDVLQTLSNLDPKMVEPRLKRMSADLQDLRRTLAPANKASKGTFVNVKTKLGRTKKTRIT